MEYLIPVVLAAIGGYYNKRFPTKIKVIYILVIWIYIFVMLGFRYKVGVDTLSYMYSFRHIKDISDLSLSDITEQRYEPGYLLLCSVCKTLFRDFWVFQMLMAAITNGCIFIFLRRYCNNIFIGLLVFFVMQWLYFSTEIMRESVAIAIFLLNYRNIENKRWLRYYLFSLLSISFHYSAIIICVFPLVRYLRLNLIYIIGCIAILFSLPIFDFMVEILPFKSITMRIDQYIIMRETFNMNWIIGELIKSIAPPLTALIIYRVAKLKLREEPMILLQIIFCIGFFSIPIIFSRFTNYTSMFVTVALANLISNTSLRNWVKATVIGIILVSQTPYYISMYRTWFPYVSIFNPKTLPDRENRWKNEFLKSY